MLFHSMAATRAQEEDTSLHVSEHFWIKLYHSTRQPGRVVLSLFYFGLNLTNLG